MHGFTERRQVAGLVAALLLAACAPPHSDGVTAPAKARAKGPAAVVADIGVGTNPYHAAFRRPGWDKEPCKSIAAIPCGLAKLDLTLGDDYAAAIAADAATWAAYQPGTIYWVPGTNLLLMTLRSVGPVLCGGAECDLKDGYGGPTAFHGIATSGAMAVACPDCYVLVIQDAPAVDGSAVEYVASELPWVDFVAQTNLSGYGTNPFAVFDDTLLDKSLQMTPFQRATRALADSGRLFFAASGDYAYPGSAVEDAPALGYTYPPWVVAVGGMTPANPFPDATEKVCNAIDVMSGTPAEMLGEFSQSLPLAESIDGYDVWKGTSFSAPQVAARFGQALADVRAQLGDARAPGALWSGRPGSGALADGQLTAAELRDVFAATARYIAPTDFNAACAAEVAQRFAAQTKVPFPLRPVSPAPWLDMGWGHVGAEEASAAAAAIIGRTTAPAKPAEARSYMDEFMSMREAAFPAP